MPRPSWILLPLVLPALAASAQPGPVLDPTAVDVLQGVSRWYRGLDHGQARIEVLLSAEEQGNAESFDASYDVAFARPNRVSIRTRSSRFGGNIVSDGSSLFLHLPSGGTYVERDAPPACGDLPSLEMRRLSAAGGIELELMRALLRDDAYETLTGAISVLAYVGKERVDDRPMHHLLMSRQGIDVHLWVHDGEQPWLHRVRPDLEKLYRSLAGQGGDAPENPPAMDLTITYRDWSTERPADELFAFAPPPGARRVRSLFAPPAGATAGHGTHPLLGEEAPAFELDRLDGGRVRLGDHRDRDVVVLDFWATWCRPCRAAMPKLAAVADAFRDRNVVFYAVNLREKDEKVRAFLETADYTMTVVMDREGTVGGAYKARSIPQTVIIGTDGTIQAVHVGLLPDLENQLTTELETLLRGEPLVDP